jgi:hypothetical protein
VAEHEDKQLAIEHPRLVTVTSNRDGFRSRRELRPGDGRTQIVMLGDSMVFGVGVEEPERFTELLEQREPDWRVENLGMVGFGPDLMLRALETVGLDPKPDVVVLGMFSHDVYRVVPEAQGAGFPVPRFALVDGKLVTVPYPDPPLWRHLRLVQVLRYMYWRYTSATFPLNAAILERFVALGEREGFVPAIAFFPGAEGADDRRRRAFRRGSGRASLDLTERPPRRAAHGSTSRRRALESRGAPGRRGVMDLRRGVGGGTPRQAPRDSSSRSFAPRPRGGRRHPGDLLRLHMLMRHRPPRNLISSPSTARADPRFRIPASDESQPRSAAQRQRRLPPCRCAGSDDPPVARCHLTWHLLVGQPAPGRPPAGAREW